MPAKFKGNEYDIQTRYSKLYHYVGCSLVPYLLYVFTIDSTFGIYFVSPSSFQIKIVRINLLFSLNYEFKFFKVESIYIYIYVPKTRLKFNRKGKKRLLDRDEDIIYTIYQNEWQIKKRNLD